MAPDWLAAAAAHQRVVVIFGSRIGVTPPDGIDPAGYDDTARRAELDDSRTAGQVVGGTVPWYLDDDAYPRYELLDLRTFGIPIPVFSFPVDELLLHGDPAEFGFEHFGKRDPEIPLPTTKVLAIDLHQGPHDVDVLNLRGWTAAAGEPPLLTGLQSPQPRPTWWTETAVDQNTVMLLATTLDPRSRGIADVGLSSWVCLAPLFLRAYPDGIGPLPPPSR